MSYIHGLGDLREGRGDQGAPEGGRSREAELFMGVDEQLDPRKVSQCRTLQHILCPYFSLYSFLFIATVIEILFYIITVIHSTVSAGSLSPDYDSFLGPCTSTLIFFGAKYPRRMQLNFEFQPYRWFMPIVLHVDFMHITFNLLSQLIIGGFIERIFGFWRTLGIYVISGVGGLLLGCLINDKISVGASGAIFGLCSALIGWLIVNWKALGPNSPRGYLLCMAIMIVAISIIVGLAGSRVDNVGHFGGLIVGFVAGMAFSRPASEALPQGNYRAQNRDDLRIRVVGASIMGGLLVLGFGLFFGLRNPESFAFGC